MLFAKNLEVHVGALLMVTCCAITAQAQMGKIDTSHVSDDSFLVVRFDIEKVISQIPMGNKDLEMISKVVKDEAGLDVMGMKAITMQFGKEGDDGPFDTSFCITFEHTKAIDREAFHENSEFDLDEYTEMTHKGAKYLRNASDGGPHLYFSDDGKTFTMATAVAVESVIEAKSGMGTMAGLLKSAPPKAEVSLAFKSAEGTQESLNEITREFGGALPFDLGKILGQLETASGHVQVKSSTPIFIQGNCKSADAATELKTAAEAGIKLGKAGVTTANLFIDGAVENADNEFEKNQMKLAKKGLALADKILAGAKSTASGKQFSFKVSHMGGLKDAVPTTLSAFKLLFMGMSGRHELGGIEDAPLKIEEPLKIDRVEKKK